MDTSTISSKGQTTIPAEIRAFLGLKPGDEVNYIKTPSGKVEISPRRRYEWQELQNILPKPKKALTDQAIQESVGQLWGRQSPKSKAKKPVRKKP